MQLPSAFIKKYQRLLSSTDSPPFLHELEEGTVKKGFRINSLKENALKICQEELPFDLDPAPYAPLSFYGEIDGKSPLHQAGLVYSQEPSAMSVATVVDPQPGECILDLCAAPGGKSTQLAAALKGKGLLVANEIIPKRAKILAENIERLGITNAIVTNHSPNQLAQHLPGYFDKVLVDAPCSGEGMFRKDNPAISEWTPQTPLTCQARQKEILPEALRLLKPGGQLIYSTCTFAPEENEEIIAWLVDHFPLHVDPIENFSTNIVSSGLMIWGQGNPDLEGTRRIWPHLHPGEGHFVARLTYQGPTQSSPSQFTSRSKKKSEKSSSRSLSREEKLYFEEFADRFNLQSIPAPSLQVFGQELWLLPTPCPNLSGLRCLRQGLHLGSFLKKRFHPSFALVMALSPSASIPKLDLSYEEWSHYIQGETFQKPGNQGWCLLCYHHMSIGFGKQVQGTVKNFYPKGLRFIPH